MAAPRKSAAAKSLAGTERTSRLASIPFVLRLNDVPAAPATMSPGAMAEWDRLAKVAVWLGTLGSSDLRGFELLCETLATEAEARADVAERGYSIATDGGGLKGNPAVKVMETARAQASRLLADFGLTPKGRQGIDTSPINRPGAVPGSAEASGGPAPVDEEAATYERMKRLRSIKGGMG